MSERKTGLVVLYNHNYEKNIEKIRRIYKERFPEMRQLMPFYYGNEPDVIRVYGNSFYFQTYIAQACEKLLQMDCDDFLIAGDDLVLHPEITAMNCHEKLEVEPGAFYLDRLVDVSQGTYRRGVEEAHNFNMYFPGLDGSANRIVPSYEAAEKCLRSQGVLGTTMLKRYPMYKPEWKHPVLGNLSANYRLFKGKVYHALKGLGYRFSPKKMSYPCVFGYSDIVLIPRERLVELCRLLEVFATWRMFVELAIPTAVLLLPDVKYKLGSTGTYKTGKFWFKETPNYFNEVRAAIEKLEIDAGGKLDRLGEAFPKEYIYLHPVKLSKMS